MSSAAESVVAVDANGADLGAQEVAAGAALAAQQGARVLLFGPAAQLQSGSALPAGVEVIDAPISIAKSADPARAARATPEASIVQAARAVAAGHAQALVCAGGTGAALAAGLFNIKRAPGIYRPALALPLPIPGPAGGRAITLLDVGANAQTRPEHLVQFAFMGAAFARAVLGVSDPRVGLLSNGEESERGGVLVREAHAELLQRTPIPFEFVGNLEGGELTTGAAEVIVTDGLTGNIALKLIEGVSQTMLTAIRAAAQSSARAQLGGLLLAPSLRSLKAEIDPELQGGAYLLGLRRLGVIPHGRFTRRGFAQAILRAAQGVREDLVGATDAGLRQAGALRSLPAASGASVEDASLRGT